VQAPEKGSGLQDEHGCVGGKVAEDPIFLSATVGRSDLWYLSQRTWVYMEEMRLGQATTQVAVQVEVSRAEVVVCLVPTAATFWPRF
jgi:hypothetical protein